eukprot:8664092-Ditylum_brightwellii.AAC.1
MELIGWDNVGITLKQQHLNNKVRLVKFMHNWLNIGHQKKQFNGDTVADCPICQFAKKNWTHLF